tara:strand:- start:798 stop:1646 length:849 start_codon:yes stop_codon:yes gene_type:complete
MSGLDVNTEPINNDSINYDVPGVWNCGEDELVWDEDKKQCVYNNEIMTMENPVETAFDVLEQTGFGNMVNALVESTNDTKIPDMLKQQWEETIVISKNAPTNEIIAGMRYYKSIDRNYGEEELRNRIEKEAEKERKEKENQYDKMKIIIQHLIIYYETNYKSFRSVNELYNVKKRKNEEMKLKIEDLKKDSRTNNRKVTYEEMAIKNLFTLKILLYLIIFIIVGLYIYYVSLSDYKNYKSWIVPFLIIIIVTFKTIISKLLYVSVDNIYYTLTTTRVKNVYI